MNLPKILKARREECDYTQAELAKLVGTTQVMIAYIEGGTKTPSLALTIKLSQVLRCSLDYLVFGQVA